jgi:hypothetical protein
MICCSRVDVPVGVDIVGVHGDGNIDVALFWDVVFIEPMLAPGRPMSCLEADLTEQ